LPPSDLPPLRIADAEGLEVCDVESHREHCAMTLRGWFERLEALFVKAGGGRTGLPLTRADLYRTQEDGPGRVT
jgi:cyclopropane fatty-acyl-phospholipid synthase-like methyltransferase